MTTHPLAKEAAEKISRNHIAPLRIREANATIIHTTAVQLILEKGDELENILNEISDALYNGPENLTYSRSDDLREKAAKVLKSWRDLKSGCGEGGKTSTKASGSL